MIDALIATGKSIKFSKLYKSCSCPITWYMQFELPECISKPFNRNEFWIHFNLLSKEKSSDIRPGSPTKYKFMKTCSSLIVFCFFLTKSHNFCNPHFAITDYEFLVSTLRECREHILRARPHLKMIYLLLYMTSQGFEAA